MTYAYADPKAHKWVGPYPTRDAAAEACGNPEGFTAAIESIERGVTTPVNLSVVRWTTVKRKLVHNAAQLARAVRAPAAEQPKKRRAKK